MPKSSDALPAFNILRKWDVTEMCNWLKKCEFQEAVPVFKDNNINGEKFVYLTEFQLFQMKNVSVKTRNGLKSAQKSVKGRPAVKKKDVITETARRSMTKVYDSINRIMASERPPQTPGKDYKYEHHTPEVDDDGWGSDFDDDSEHDSVHEEDDDLDDEYEEPQQNTTSHPTAAMTSHANHRAPHQRELPPPRRPLPKEPPENKYPTSQEQYELEDDEPEDYEEPIDTTQHRPPLQPRNHPVPAVGQSLAPARRHSPPSLPSDLPPRLPPRGKAEENSYEIANKDSPQEDYEQPETPSGRSYFGRSDRSEVVNKSGPLKPSNVAKQKTNYTKVEIPKTEARPSNSWMNPAGGGMPVKPSDLKNSQRNSGLVTKDQPPPLPSNKHRPAVQSMLGKSLGTDRTTGVPTTERSTPSTGWTGRGLPKPPEEQEIEGLYSYTWYHGDLNRDTATTRLEAKARNGMFLVRKSSRDGSPYALSLYFGDRVYNLNIRLRADNKYALGSVKEDEKAFISVPNLINYFQNNTLVLAGNKSTITTLKQALPK